MPPDDRRDVAGVRGVGAVERVTFPSGCYVGLAVTDEEGTRDPREMTSCGDADVPFTVDPECDGAMRLTWASGAHIDEATAEHAMRHVDEANAIRRHPLIVDAAGPFSMTRHGRLVFLRPCTVSAVALVGRTAVERVLANFVIRLSTPPVPTRLFPSEPSARTWLRSLSRVSSADGAR